MAKIDNPLALPAILNAAGKTKGRLACKSLPTLAEVVVISLLKISGHGFLFMVLADQLKQQTYTAFSKGQIFRFIDGRNRTAMIKSELLQVKV